MGKVYIARGGGLYKFGNSENPEERLKQLQTGSPVPLEIVYTFDARTPKKAETELKRMFAAKHAHGEWFKLTEADVLSVKQATTPMPSSDTPDVNPSPPVAADALSGAYKALSDIWAHRYYLLLLMVCAVPFILVMENDSPLTDYFAHSATPVARPTSAPLTGYAQPVPTAAPLPVPVNNVSAPVEPTPSELIPINDATAAALGAFVPTPEPTSAWALPPTVEPIVVTWLDEPTPLSFEDSMWAAQTAWAQRGFQAMPNVTPVAPKNFVGR